MVLILCGYYIILIWRNLATSHIAVHCRISRKRKTASAAQTSLRDFVYCRRVFEFVYFSQFFLSDSVQYSAFTRYYSFILQVQTNINWITYTRFSEENRLVFPFPPNLNGMYFTSIMYLQLNINIIAKYPFILRYKHFTYSLLL